MHSAGNDFVLLDCRVNAFTGGASARALLCERHLGVGCDQLIEMYTASAESSPAEFALRFYNQDGSPADACGNGTRCAASWLMQRHDISALTFIIADRILPVWQENACIWVNMGRAEFCPTQVPMTLTDSAQLMQVLALNHDEIVYAMACSMGNPHLVLLCTSPLSDKDIVTLGTRLERHEIFPEYSNVGFMHVQPDGLHLRVWERGIGETLACGSGACAAFAVARQYGARLQDVADVILPGGVLTLRAQGEDVLMTGPVAMVAEGFWHG